MPTQTQPLGFRLGREPEKEEGLACGTCKPTPGQPLLLLVYPITWINPSVGIFLDGPRVVRVSWMQLTTASSAAHGCTCHRPVLLPSQPQSLDQTKQGGGWGGGAVWAYARRVHEWHGCLGCTWPPQARQPMGSYSPSGRLRLEKRALVRGGINAVYAEIEEVHEGVVKSSANLVAPARIVRVLMRSVFYSGAQTE